MHLDGQVLHRVSNALTELYRPDGDEFPCRVIRVMSQLVTVESCSYNELDGQSAVAYQVEPADVVSFPDADELFRKHLPEHPLVHYYEATGDYTAKRVSDVASDRQFRSLGLYQDFYRPARVDYQLAVSVPAPDGTLIAVALNRHGLDFTAGQRDLVELLRPHLGQAAAIARLLTEPLPGCPSDAGGEALLTPRQARILQLVAAGSPDRAVARALGISIRTVHGHLQHIYRALGVSSRTEAVAQARALALARPRWRG